MERLISGYGNLYIKDHETDLMARVSHVLVTGASLVIMQIYFFKAGKTCGH